MRFPFLIIVFYWEFLADVEIIVKAVIVLIDDAHAAIGRRNLQNLQQMPFRFAKVIGFSVKDDAVGNEVKVIVAATDTLVAWLQQMFMLVDHAKTEIAVHCNYKLR